MILRFLLCVIQFNHYFSIGRKLIASASIMSTSQEAKLSAEKCSAERKAGGSEFAERLERIVDDGCLCLCVGVGFRLDLFDHLSQLCNDGRAPVTAAEVAQAAQCKER